METGRERNARLVDESASGGDFHGGKGYPPPSWRGWVISIIVAVILSVTVTFLLGGSHERKLATVRQGCGGGECLHPSGGEAKPGR